MRSFFILLAFLCVVGLGLSAIHLMWADGAPMWWVLRGRHFERVLVRWNGKTLDSRDPQVISRFEKALRGASRPLPYPTRCLPDAHENWPKWSVTLFDSRAESLEADVGLDGCGAFYLPSINTTYIANPDLIEIVNQSLGRPPKTSPFRP